MTARTAAWLDAAADVLAWAGVAAPGAWLGRALDGQRVAPLLLSGGNAELVGRAFAVAGLRADLDVLVLPRVNLRSRATVPDDLPQIAVALVGGDEVDPAVLEHVAERAALLVCGDPTPLVDRGHVVVECLPDDRAGDLALLDAAGWPLRA